ncbi:phosphonate ABC transporter, permease protein PhnE [Halobacteriales archaeon QH_10_67_13]|nr:MAG: phosphonate ABC transporter, permease protein PhnE [Halobacteriales archaeon QH_10_67_13]
MSEDEDTASPETAADGGVDQAETDRRIASHFEEIKQGRRRRGIGWAVLLVFIGFVSVQAANAAELLDADPDVDTFMESLFDTSNPQITPFFPPTQVDALPTSLIPFVNADLPIPFSFPFIDFGQYIEFILEFNLLYDPEIGSLLLQWPPNPGDIYAFFFTELGIFNVFGEAGITLAMGFIGTVIGFPLALTFGILGSERVTPFPFNFLFRGTMSFIRSIPAIIWALIFIPFLGLGPASAAIAIAFDTIGNLGRLFVDELEEIEDGPIEAMETTGASQPQVVFFGMLSQVRTAFIAWTLYIFEINVRIAVTLGVIGAGGLGRVVNSQQGLLRFTDLMAALLCIFLLVISVELFSQRLRSRLRSDEERMGWWELIFGFPDRMANTVRR